MKLVGVKVKKVKKVAKKDDDYQQYQQRMKWYEDSGFKKLREDMRAARKRFGNDSVGVFNVDFEFHQEDVSCSADIDGPSVPMSIYGCNVYCNTLKENMDAVKKYLDKLGKQQDVLKRAIDYAEKTAAKFQKQIDSLPPEVRKAMKQW